MLRSNKRLSRRHAAPPRGVTIILILACLVAAMMISGTIVHSLIRTTEETNSLQHQAQVDWLIRSGFDRAQTRLRSNTRYQGETLNLRTGWSRGQEKARVVVRVTDDANDESHRLVHVQVQLGTNSVDRLQRSRSTRVSVSKTE